MDKRWPALEIGFASPAIADLVQAALTDFPISAVDEGSPDASPSVWRVFFTSAEARDDAADTLHDAFPGHLSIAALDVADDDWAARSQANLHAVHVGGIIVSPPWEAAANPKAQSPKPNETPNPTQPITVVIQPSMGFGTGHHATTRLCLGALQALDLRRKRVLDVGTGSGVLAIAAARLGAIQVLGIDDDEDAIASARENLALNPGADVTLGVVDLRKATLRPFDLLLANLTGALLVSAASTLASLSGGRLILSGFQAHEADDVRAAFAGWTVEREAREDEWGCVTLVRS